MPLNGSNEATPDMKILVAHNFYRQRGGEDVSFEKERDLLRRAGHEVIEYCRSNEETQNCSSVLAKIRLAKYTIGSNESYSELRSLLATEKPDVVHVHNTFVMISPSIFNACHDAGIPVVQTVHNYRMLCPAGDFFRDGQVCEECREYGVFRSITHACYRESRFATATVAGMIAINRKRTWSQMVDRFIVLTEFSRSKFRAAKFPAEKLTIKPNFVHPDPGVGDASGGYALFVGRLSREKGLPTLISAWERLPKSVMLHIIGDGPLGEALQRQASEQGLENITFHGTLGSREVMQIMRAARLLVFPSQCYENCPLTILEAYACGVPVIASRLGAMQEIVDDGRTGLHFDSSDPSDLPAKILWAWSHPNELTAMRREARAEFESRYTAEKNYEVLMDIYKSVLAADHSAIKREKSSNDNRLPIQAVS
jgi:glycosyltransferase involved in cell wall biosynthesis